MTVGGFAISVLGRFEQRFCYKASKGFRTFLSVYLNS